MRRVAFSGEPGAYAEDAIYRLFGEAVETVPKGSFAEAVEAVVQHRCQGAVLPIENSTTGTVEEAQEVLLHSPLVIVEEVSLAVRHCLLAPPGRTLDEIRHVHSHPQALKQCAVFLRSHGLAAVTATSTSAAARSVAGGEAGEGAAAIASPRAARLYGLAVLGEAIQDQAGNATRFFALAWGTGAAGAAEVAPRGNSMGAGAREAGQDKGRSQPAGSPPSEWPAGASAREGEQPRLPRAERAAGVADRDEELPRRPWTAPPAGTSSRDGQLPPSPWLGAVAGTPGPDGAMRAAVSLAGTSDPETLERLWRLLSEAGVEVARTFLGARPGVEGIFAELKGSRAELGAAFELGQRAFPGLRDRGTWTERPER